MNLQGHVDELAAIRVNGGLYLEPAELLQCAVLAAREYSGFTALEDVSAASGAISGTTETTPSEWAIIGPLFELLVERENALRLEASASLGVQMVGRSSAEVSGDINQYRSERLGVLAFQVQALSVGYPEGY